MGDFYRLTYTGLASAISSSRSKDERLVLLHILAGNGQGDMSTEQLCLISGLAGDKVESLINSLLAEGSLSRNSAHELADHSALTGPSELITQLEALSVNGKIILADAHGLIIASSGYSQTDSEYISAIATNLVQVSERAKARIKNRKENTLWYTGLSWGDLRGLCLSIYIGSKQYILVVGGIPSLEKPEFFNIVGFLVRRYGYG